MRRARATRQRGNGRAGVTRASARSSRAPARPPTSPNPKETGRTVARRPARPLPRTGDRRNASEHEVEPTDQRRRASAGRILGVGMLCFLLWLLFDANQLYHSAEAGQIGVRRTVAMSILRPIAAITNFLGISGPVNTANTALGRCGAGAGSVCDTNVTVPPPAVIPQPPPGYMGRGGAPHLGPGAHYVPPPPPPVRPGPPPLVSPTAAHPLTLLSIGDSIGEDLGYGIGDVFSNDAAVHVIQQAVEDTGLSRSDYYNWPATLESYLARDHPQIVVVMMGANDAQSLYANNGIYLSFGTAAWWQAYAARVSLVMSEATAAGARRDVGRPAADGAGLHRAPELPGTGGQGLLTAGGRPSGGDLLLGREGARLEVRWFHALSHDQRNGPADPLQRRRAHPAAGLRPSRAGARGAHGARLEREPARRLAGEGEPPDELPAPGHALDPAQVRSWAPAPSWLAAALARWRACSISASAAGRSAQVAPSTDFPGSRSL